MIHTPKPVVSLKSEVRKDNKVQIDSVTMWVLEFEFKLIVQNFKLLNHPFIVSILHHLVIFSLLCYSVSDFKNILLTVCHFYQIYDMRYENSNYTV